MAYKLRKGTLNNENYRYVVYTSEQMQLVLMSLKPGEDIHKEIHYGTTQFIKVEEGEAKVKLGASGEKTFILKSGDCILIPANTYHYVLNSGTMDLKLYTLYSPPEHPKDRIDITNPKSKDDE